MATKTVCDGQGCMREQGKGDKWFSLTEDASDDEPFGGRYRDFCSWACLAKYVQGRAG